MTAWWGNRAAVTLDRDHTIDLDRADQWWVVVRGDVEVYVRDQDALSRTGSGTEIATIGRRREGLIGRRFVLHASSGMLLSSFDGRAADEGVLVSISGQHAELVLITQEEMVALLQGPHAAVIERALSQWVDALSAAVGPGDECVHPIELHAGTKEWHERFETMRPARDLLWAAVVDGRCAVLGREELVVERGQWTPVTLRTWLQVSENPAEIESRTARDPVVAPELRATLVRFQHGVLRAHLADTRRHARLEFDRLHTRAIREQRQLTHAFGMLADVVDGTSPTVCEDTMPAGDALLAACRLVAAASGVALPVVPDARKLLQMREPIEAIAAASRVRARAVALRGRWWEHDVGALVATRAEDGAPLALRRDARGYTATDAVTGEHYRITARAASTLEPTAYMFLPSLGRGSVQLADLWRFGLSAVRREVIGILLLSGLTAALATIAPLLTRALVDDVLPQAERAQLPVVVAMLVIAVLMGALLATLQRLLLLRAEARIELHLESALMDRLLRLPLAFFRRFLAGDLAERVNAVAAIRSALSGSALPALLHGVFAVASLLLLLAFDKWLALVGIGLASIALAVVTTSTIVSIRHQRHIAERGGRLSGTLLQLISAMAKIRVAGAERRAFGVWAEQFAQQRALHVRAGETQNRFQLFRACYPLLAFVAFCAVLFVNSGAGGVVSHISTGSFIAALAAFSQFTGGMLGLGNTVLTVLRVVPQWERVAPILATPEEVRVHSADPGVLHGAVEFRHVTFRYGADTPLVLEDISFRAEPGEMVALVGASGSGKSTVVRLLLGLEHAANGSILLDGQDVQTLDLPAVRQQIGVVTQAARVTPGDIAGNILGPWNLTQADAWRAARLAGIADDIEQMPMGMHTVIGEGGGTFSGGQLQRLLIARALVHTPRLLVLDEATSALDNGTQRQVSECLERLAVTRIVIAHRLSTIRQADRIYVLDRGRIVETGTYASLLERDGAFAALARRQFA